MPLGPVPRGGVAALRLLDQGPEAIWQLLAHQGGEAQPRLWLPAHVPIGDAVREESGLFIQRESTLETSEDENYTLNG